MHINSVCGVTGTGRIVADLYKAAVDQGHECRIAYGEHKYQNTPGDMQTMKIGSLRGNQMHALYTRLFDMQGFGSRGATEMFLKEVTRYAPDVVHLHNLHGYYIHIGLLFRYLKERNIKVVWTLHDCWPFTGHCVHFQNAGCEKWKEGCYHCPLKRQYPASMWADCRSAASGFVPSQNGYGCETGRNLYGGRCIRQSRQRRDFWPYRG